LNDLVGGQGADLVKSLLANSTDPAAGTTATLVGIVVLVATASGVFGEMQTALNTIWNVRTSDQPFYSLIRTRAASLGLVAAFGFLMIVSLAASTALSAIGHYLSAAFPLAQLLLATLNTLVSLALFTLLFGAIYSVLPEALSRGMMSQPVASSPRHFLQPANRLSAGISAAPHQAAVTARPAPLSCFCFGPTTLPRFFYSAPRSPKRSSIWRASRRQLDRRNIRPIECERNASLLRTLTLGLL
jgi:Virulence factor BrkB